MTFDDFVRANGDTPFGHPYLAAKAAFEAADRAAREDCAEICARLSIDLDRQRNTADACKQAIMESIK